MQTAALVYELLILWQMLQANITTACYRCGLVHSMLSVDLQSFSPIIL